MNRSRRFPQNKPFVHGGTYNGQNDMNRSYQNQQQTQQQNQQYQQPQRQPQNTFQQARLKNNDTLQQQSNNQEYDGYYGDQQQQQQQQPQQQLQNQYESVKQDAGQLNCDIESKPETDDMDITDENGKLKFKKIFLTRKKSSGFRAREKKIRQNRQLRKAIMPKNALMALNEVKGISMSDFVVNNNTTGGFTAEVTVNSNQYEGKGISKAAAKNSACEKALRDYVIAKMISKPRMIKASSEASIEPMDADDVEEPTKEDENKEEADDVPMVNLASFALFKLFSEWENEGFVIPEMHPAAQNGVEPNPAAAVKEPKKPPIRSELPENWENMHPSTLLCMMRPGVTYAECVPIGEKPNVLQKVSVVVDEQNFFGTGRSKKIARRNAAVAVCNSLFGTNFEEEVTPTA